MTGGIEVFSALLMLIPATGLNSVLLLGGTMVGGTVAHLLVVLGSLVPAMVLGLWMAQTESVKFWLQVMTELKNCGVADIFIACVDGLKGFTGAIEAAFPNTAVQLCLVHTVRHSLNFVGWKQRKAVAADLQLIYTAATDNEALLRLTEFESKWDAFFAPIVQAWRRNWSRQTPFFDYPPDIRKVIYTTNAIESVNMGLRKITKNRGSFPTDDAVFKLFYLALNNISQ